MSLLQSIVGQLFGDQSTDQQQHSLLDCVAGLINHPQVGGLSGLSQLFHDQGLGHIVDGWIGNGPNPPITADQIRQVLGSPRIAEMAAKLGIDPNQAATQLAAILPHAVDQLTPNGTVPAQGTLNAQAILCELKTKFLGA